jgi:putative hydrolase of the HAD superfamily
VRGLSDIRGIVFDLDGTLYVSPSFAAAIQDAATDYVAGIRGTTAAEAKQLMAATRCRLIEQRDELPTLSAVCSEIGGNALDLHRFFVARLQPEAHLIRDQRVTDLLERLARQYYLSLFTNNNRALTFRILDLLGMNGIFRRIYAIDDSWQPKPDDGMLDRILAEAGLSPPQVLFVGDRYDVDLRLPEQRGCPVYLIQSIEQLLQLGELLKE